MGYDFHRIDAETIVFIGAIPEVFDGYEQDPVQKNTWRSIWEPCKYREERPFRCPNGRLRLVTSCSLHDSVTSYTKCSGCPDLVSPDLPDVPDVPDSPAESPEPAEAAVPNVSDGPVEPAVPDVPTVSETE